MLNWILERFQRRHMLRPAAPHIQPVAQRQSFHWPDLGGVTAQAETYSKSSWVYTAVNRIAEAAALVPLHVYRVQDGQRVQVERHPLAVLLDCPNPFISRFELLEQTVGMLELTGNAYWFLSGDTNGQPTQIWPLRPDRVRIVPDENDYVRGYVYEVDGQSIPMDAIEVVHFKRWNPGNDYYGLSALQAARHALTTDSAMAEWNRNSFGKNYGVPAGIVNIKEYVTDADFERIKREWRQSYGGAQRRTAFLRGGGIEWQNIGLNHTDMDYLKGRSANRDEILNIFGIPVGLVSENSTEANAKVAERMFIERTLWPKLVRIAQKITQELLPFYPGEHIAEFADIRPTDVQARLNEIRTASVVMSINEIRQQYYQLPPVAWGDLPASAPIQVEAIEEAPPAPATKQVHADTDSIQAELARWERFAIKRVGKAARPFEVSVIPEEVAFEVDCNLLLAENVDEAKAVFSSAMGLVSECKSNMN